MGAPMNEPAKHAPADRQRLPNRRAHELLDFAYNGRRFTAGVGYFVDGRLAESLSTFTEGSQGKPKGTLLVALCALPQ